MYKITMNNEVVSKLAFDNEVEARLMKSKLYQFNKDHNLHDSYAIIELSETKRTYKTLSSANKAKAQYKRHSRIVSDVFKTMMQINSKKKIEAYALILHA